jgi:hypothetical protein
MSAPAKEKEDQVEELFAAWFPSGSDDGRLICQVGNDIEEIACQLGMKVRAHHAFHHTRDLSQLHRFPVQATGAQGVKDIGDRRHVAA